MALFDLFFWKNKGGYRTALCGHESKRTDNVSAFGETVETTVPLVKGKIDYCHKCLGNMAIKCAWCGRPIFIGDFITLYSPSEDEEFKIPEGAIVYSKKPLVLVGCQRIDCAETSADYCGTWMPPGIVHRQKSAFETALENPNCVVIGHNRNGKIETKIIKRDD